jgi:long-chain acyl-CoA synthetase
METELKRRKAIIMNYAMLLRQWAAREPDKDCFITRQHRYSYRDIEQAMQKYAETLPECSSPKGTLLIVRQDPVAQLVAFLGAQEAGFVPVLGHPDLTASMADHLAEQRGIQWVDDGSFRSAEKGILPSSNVCMGVLSSGSTGLPKLMFRTYESWADFFPEQNRLFQVNHDTAAFVEGSMSFTGNLNVWASVLYAGATMVIDNTLQPRNWEELLRKYHATYIYLVPVKLKLLLRSLKEVFPEVRTVMAGSQLLDETTATNLKRAFPHSEIYLYYGASELDYITCLTYDELLRHPMSVGKPCKGVRVFIRDGLIYIDTPYHVEGLPRPCTLNDEGYFDKDGYLIFEGRRGNIVNKGGVTISCAKVEQVLQGLPYVDDAIVLPCSDRERGQDMAAFLILNQKRSGKDIRRDLTGQLLPVEIPKYFSFLDRYPLNGAGKIDYQALLERLHRS